MKKRDFPFQRAVFSDAQNIMWVLSGCKPGETHIPKEVLFLSANSDIAMTVLRLLAECGRVSRRTFDILPFSYRNTCVYIKKLVDSRGVSLSGKGSTKSYILLDHGRKTLSAYNPQRYTPELFELNKLLIRHADRSRLRGDVAAIMSLSGFAVHPDDKPTLPVNTPKPPDLRYASLRSLYKSTQPFQYGQIIPNLATYTEHLTPANCYYDSVQIKYLRQTATDKGINYSRACGVLFTPSNLFRVYHSRDVAMRFFKTGEENFSALLKTAFTGYVPADTSGILVFGQEWLSAISILDNYLREKTIPPPKKGDVQGDILNPANLGNPLFYLPLRSEAMELLRLMRFPDWRRSLMYYASITHAGLKQTGWSYQHENRRVCIVADLSLTNLGMVLRGMMKNPREPVSLICLPWQQEFILGLARDYGGERVNAEILLLHDNFMENLINSLMEPYWG